MSDDRRCSCVRCRRDNEPICAYRNEKMNHIRALIMIKRKMTAATTQVIINVIFERLEGVEFGNKSKFERSSNKKTRPLFPTSFIH